MPVANAAVQRSMWEANERLRIGFASNCSAALHAALWPRCTPRTTPVERSTTPNSLLPFGTTVKRGRVAGLKRPTLS